MSYRTWFQIPDGPRYTLTLEGFTKPGRVAYRLRSMGRVVAAGSLRKDGIGAGPVSAVAVLEHLAHHLKPNHAAVLLEEARRKIKVS